MGRVALASANGALARAKSAKQDEFYTQLSDIENELRHYRTHLRGKVIFCNCDDPYESNFFRYFAINFNNLGLKSLIATSYKGSAMAGNLLPFVDFKGLESLDHPYAIEINSVPDANRDGAIDLADVKWLLMNDSNTSRILNSDSEYGPGDFRSKQCIEYLKSADIVVTNPPFSLFREFVDLMIHYEKSFLIVGNQNQVTADEIANLVIEGKIWQGNYTGDMAFRVPDDYEPRETRYWIDEHGKNGVVLARGVGTQI